MWTNRELIIPQNFGFGPKLLRIRQLYRNVGADKVIVVLALHRAGYVYQVLARNLGMSPAAQCRERGCVRVRQT